MTNYLDRFPLLQAIMEQSDHVSRSFISNPSSNSSADSQRLNVHYQTPDYTRNDNCNDRTLPQYSTHTHNEKVTSPKSYNQFEINPLFKIASYNAALGTKNPSLREHIFISKQCTKLLAKYIVRENWGSPGHGLLYKYLDYIFRCQLFKQQVIQIDNQCLMFHTGLQRRSDSEFLYALLIPNKKHMQQQWRVGFGAIQHSFLSKREILHKLRYLLHRNPATHASTNNTLRLLSDILPKRTKFHQRLEEFLFDESYQIEVNWEERILTNKDRICKVLGVADFTKKWEIRQLMNSFDRALEKTKKTLRLNPRLAVAQGFVDTKRWSFRMELLLPLNIEYPKFSKIFHTFALAICKSTDQTETYTAKSILNTEMAYANARLVSYVDSSWLQSVFHEPHATNSDHEVEAC